MGQTDIFGNDVKYDKWKELELRTLKFFEQMEIDYIVKDGCNIYGRSKRLHQIDVPIFDNNGKIVKAVECKHRSNKILVQKSDIDKHIETCDDICAMPIFVTDTGYSNGAIKTAHERKVELIIEKDYIHIMKEYSYIKRQIEKYKEINKYDSILSFYENVKIKSHIRILPGSPSHPDIKSEYFGIDITKEEINNYDGYFCRFYDDEFIKCVLLLKPGDISDECVDWYYENCDFNYDRDILRKLLSREIVRKILCAREKLTRLGLLDIAKRERWTEEKMEYELNFRKLKYKL